MSISLIVISICAETFKRYYHEMEIGLEECSVFFWSKVENDFYLMAFEIWSLLAFLNKTLYR